MITIGKHQIPKDLFLFFIISALLGVVSAVESTSFANRLYEDLHFTILQRTFLETPRELPGLLTVLFIGLLNGLGDIRIAAVANIIGGIGLLLFGLTPNVFTLILVFLVIYSTGQHIYLPLSSSIAMGFASGDQFGRRMGEVQSVGSLSIILASGALYILYTFTEITYQTVFVFAAFCMITTGFLFFSLGTQSKRIVGEKRFVFRKEYKMYYILSVVNGARKQITMTFVPWLIIDVFKQPVTTITALFFVTCVINIFFKPFYGRLVDRKGERFALQLEAVVMFIACIGFAFSKSFLPFQLALLVVGFCYIIDKLMESANIARATYVKRLSREDSEVARTLSMGLSMDHAVSMFIPIVAGLAWYAGGASGYMTVFLGGLGISVLNFFIASRI